MAAKERKDRKGREVWSRIEFTKRLRGVGADHYHDQHPFHRNMNEGTLGPKAIRGWVANRFYYQRNIPIKDAFRQLVAHRPAPGTYIISDHYVARIRAVSRDWMTYEPIGRIGESLWVYTF